MKFMQSKSNIQKYSYPLRINLSELVNDAKQQLSLQCEPCITYVNYDNDNKYCYYYYYYYYYYLLLFFFIINKLLKL